jgi:hypothetical protein
MYAFCTTSNWACTKRFLLFATFSENCCYPIHSTCSGYHLNGICTAVDFFSKAHSWIFVVTVRVTGLGEFSPIGWLFAFGCNLKVTKAAHCLWLLNSQVYALIETKMGWAIFWAKFSQAHLVTLVTINC